MDNSNVATAHHPESIVPITPPGGNVEHRQSLVEPSMRPVRPGEINSKNLQEVQKIQSVHSNFENLNEYEQTNLKFSLANAGLPETGAIFNTVI